MSPDPSYALMVSDRLTSLVSPVTGGHLGTHDTVANKSVVYLSRDAIVTFGIAGTAYLDGIPTDQWVARELAGQEFQAGPFPGTFATQLGGSFRRTRINDVLFRLKERLLTTPGGNGVALIVAGWRIRRNRAIPMLATLHVGIANGPNQSKRAALGGS